jgi:Rieske Fe-S protein
MAKDTTRPDGPGRRGFLDVVLGAGVIGLFSSVVYPVLRYLKPLGSGGQSDPVKLTKEEIAKLDREHSVVVRGGFGRVLVFDDPNQGLRALDARCTHEGCTVQFVPGDAAIVCACHNGRFDLDGRNIAGPPPRPLAQHTVVREADGAVVVAPGTKGVQA